jgi:hypothetical protein
MFNQQTEDTKTCKTRPSGSIGAYDTLLQFCLLFGAGGGEGAVDCISQPERGEEADLLKSSLAQ